MRVNTQPEIRRLLLEARKCEALERRLERAKVRAAAREQAERRKRALPLVRRARAWARAFAQEERLPKHGVAVFASGRTTAQVMPSGKLVFAYSSSGYGRREQDMVYVPFDVLEGFLETIESGAVWDHVERMLRRLGPNGGRA